MRHGAGLEGHFLVHHHRAIAGIDDHLGRTERRLIADYEAMIGDLAAKLTKRNHRFAVALARIPDEIRGYGPVKEKSVEKAEKNKAALLAQFANPPAEEKETRLEAAE